MCFRFNDSFHVVVFLTLTFVFGGTRASQVATVFLALRAQPLLYYTLHRHAFRFIPYMFSLMLELWRRFRGAMRAPCRTLHPMTTPRPGKIPHVGFPSIPFVI